MPLSPEDAAENLARILQNVNVFMREAREFDVVLQIQDKDGSWSDVTEINGRIVFSLKKIGAA